MTTAPAVVVVQVLLVVTGVLDPTSALGMTLVIEACLLLIALTLAVAAGGTYRRLRAEGANRGWALHASAVRWLPGPVVTIARHEVHVSIHEDDDAAPVISLTPSGMTDVSLHVAEGATALTNGRALTGPVIHVTCDDPAELVRHVEALRQRTS